MNIFINIYIDKNFTTQTNRLTRDKIIAKICIHEIYSMIR